PLSGCRYVQEWEKRRSPLFRVSDLRNGFAYMQSYGNFAAAFHFESTNSNQTSYGHSCTSATPSDAAHPRQAASSEMASFMGNPKRHRETELGRDTDIDWTTAVYESGANLQRHVECHPPGAP